MKALITAGGRGTRLRPITNTLNKHLIPLANKPMIYYALEKVLEVGIKEIGIIINPNDKEIPKAIEKIRPSDVKVEYIEQKEGPLGLAHCVKIARDFIKEDNFVFYLGDNILNCSIKPFIEKFESDKLNCLLALSKVKDPQRFGVPVIQGDRILKVIEKPKEPPSPYAVTGIYIYDKNVFEAVEHIKPSLRGEYEISDVHTYLIEKGFKVSWIEVTGWWKDTGKPEDLLEGNQFLISQIKSEILGEVEEGVVVQGKVKIGKGSKIQGRSLIRGPAVIGKNCLIKDSFIGPFTSINDNCEIYSTEIENSIVLEYCNIRANGRIVDSIIGRNSMILPYTSTYPSGHKMIIGFNSFVEI